MTNSLLPTLSPLSEESNPIHIQFSGAVPTVSSKEVALHFQKKHKHVLAEIKRIQSMVPVDFYEPNFRPIEENVLLPHSGGLRKDPAYLLTRDGFSLLAMGFTGKAAILWKLRYIEAFNALEEHALELAREAGYQQGLENGVTPLALEAAEKASWLAGFKEGERKGRCEMRRRDGLARLEKALPYLQKGLNRTETARLVGCPPSTLSGTIKRFKRLTAQTGPTAKEQG